MLQKSRSKVPLQYRSFSIPLFIKYIFFFYYFFNITILLTLLIIFLILSSISLCFYLFLKQRINKILINIVRISLFISFILVVSITIKWYSEYYTIYGVVINDANINNIPAIQAEIKKNIPNGVEVIINHRKEKSDWYRIKLPDESEGWINKKNVLILDLKEKDRL